MAKGNGDPRSFSQGVQDFICTLIAEFDQLTPEQETLITGFRNNERESFGECPRCKKPVYKGKKNYYCSGGESCDFFLLKEPSLFKKSRKKLTGAMVKDFLSKGQTLVEGLYSEKKDKTYDAIVSIEDTGDKWINFKLSFDGLPKKKQKN